MTDRPLPVLLVTGFGAFPGAPFNPSQAIVERLSGTFERRIARLGVRLERRILPVVFSGAEQRLASLLSETRPAAVLHIGLAGRRKTLGVEVRARNVVSRLHPDAARACAERQTVETLGPSAIRSRWPAIRTAVALTRKGAPARLSTDAGTYVCNQTLYLTLRSSAPIVGFIHIPRPAGRRPLSRVRRERPDVGVMIRAIEAVLMSMASEIRR